MSILILYLGEWVDGTNVISRTWSVIIESLDVT